MGNSSFSCSQQHKASHEQYNFVQLHLTRRYIILFVIAHQYNYRTRSRRPLKCNTYVLNILKYILHYSHNENPTILRLGNFWLNLQKLSCMALSVFLSKTRKNFNNFAHELVCVVAKTNCVGKYWFSSRPTLFGVYYHRNIRHR